MPGRVGFYLAGGAFSAPSLAEQAKIARGHIEAMLGHYGEQLGLRNARKHIGWYIEKSGRAVDVVKAWRRRLCTEGNPAIVLDGLSEFYDETLEAAA
jgi:tRNA-dihydrouridine synthase